MAPTGLTFQDIQTWAIQDFPGDFRLLPDAKAFSIQFNIVRGNNHDNNFKSLIIGSTYTKTGKPADIMAWLAGSRIQIGYIGENSKGEPQIHHMAFAEESTSLCNFKFPFNLILPTQSETKVACFNAMLRYYFLAKGWDKGVIDESDVFNRFVARFPYACKAVASAVGLESGLNANSCDAVNVRYASRIPGESADRQPLHEQRTPYPFEQIANNPFPCRSYTVLSSPSPSPPPVEDEMIPQELHFPPEVHADANVRRSPQTQSRSGDPLQVSAGGDQMLAFHGSNDTGERDESGLRKKVFDLNIRLMIAEGLARDAESSARTAQQEAQLWRERYEGAESYKIKYQEIRNRFGLQE